MFGPTSHPAPNSSRLFFCPSVQKIPDRTLWAPTQRSRRKLGRVTVHSPEGVYLRSYRKSSLVEWPPGVGAVGIADSKSAERNGTRKQRAESESRRKKSEVPKMVGHCILWMLSHVESRGSLRWLGRSLQPKSNHLRKKQRMMKKILSFE